MLTEELSVRAWSPGAEEMWGLRGDEAVGKSLLALDIGLPAEVVTPHLRTLLTRAGDGSPALELTAVNRRGKTVSLGSPPRRSAPRRVRPVASSW